MNDQKGFTLSELLIALVVSGIVVAGAVVVFTKMVRYHNTQTRITKTEQNLRAALFYLERYIRMAGYDPTDEAGAGFTTILSNEIQFTMDKGDGTNGNEVPDGKINDFWEEQIAFKLDVNDLKRNKSGAWWVVADDIDALNFVYLDSGSNVTTNSADVRSVQVTIVARGGDQPGFTTEYSNPTVFRNLQGAIVFDPPDDGIRRTALSATISCRNMGW